MHHMIELNSHRFYIRRMDPFTALGVLADLQRTILSPILRGASGKELGDKTKVTEALVSGLEEISSSLGRDQTLALARMLLDPEFISVEIRLDNGTYSPAEKLRDAAVMVTLRGASDMLTLCVEVVKVNYADFLEPLAPLISKARSLTEGQLADFQRNSPKN